MGILKPALEYLRFGTIIYEEREIDLYRHSKTGKYFTYDGKFIILEESKINMDTLK